MSTTIINRKWGAMLRLVCYLWIVALLYLLAHYATCAAQVYPTLAALPARFQPQWPSPRAPSTRYFSILINKDTNFKNVKEPKVKLANRDSLLKHQTCLTSKPMLKKNFDFFLPIGKSVFTRVHKATLIDK